MNPHPKRRRTFIVLMAAFALITVPVFSTSAYADDSHSIEKKLEKAIEDYSDAKASLDKAQDNQKQLKSDISDGEEQIESLADDVGDFADAAYLNGGSPSATAMLATGSPEEAISGLAMVNYLGDSSGKKLQKYVDAQSSLQADKDDLADEIKDAKHAVSKKKKAKDAAQRKVDDDQGSSGGGGADPAPRNPDGSWPDETCSVDDPTGTGGCITPRMNHFYDEARSAGYKNYTACYRSGEDGGEHPRGRACDFAAASGGFEGPASGSQKQYGNNLAQWAIDNADPLGVMYVIWYNRIWDPANGWGPYSGGGTGDPSTDHTNHVHVSML